MKIHITMMSSPKPRRAQRCGVGAARSLLGTPFYFVHPCETAALMRDAMSVSAAPAPCKHLLSWLSTMGPAVGVVVPVALAHALLHGAPA